MSRVLLLSLAILAATLLGSATRAAHDLETGSLPVSGYEILVVEAEGCIYCQIFRRDVLPAYATSPRARQVPMRFVDVNAADAAKIALNEPVELVPTALVLKEGREVGRIAGYVGPEAFFHSINRLLAIAP
jgi:thioredoxin-related protein